MTYIVLSCAQGFAHASPCFQRAKNMAKLIIPLKEVYANIKQRIQGIHHKANTLLQLAKEEWRKDVITTAKQVLLRYYESTPSGRVFTIKMVVWNPERETIATKQR